MSAPAYLTLHSEGEIASRAEKAHALREDGGCHACPRECRQDRAGGDRGACGLRETAVIAYAAPYFAEEQCLTGEHGSGAIFFSGCNLRCAICKDVDVSSDPDSWRPVTVEELASFMVSLQARNVANINLMTPSHVIPEILDALQIAAESGLNLPIAFNTSGYDRAETLQLLEGIVDIYVTDFRFSDAEVSRRWTAADDYPQVVKAAIREMHRQVGDLELDERGLAKRGLLVRHLVLPGGLSGTPEVVRFLAEEVSRNTAVNLMGSYVPPDFAREPLDRRPTREEISDALENARSAGLRLIGDGAGL
jgi:putative pyruvate formate lyase activating enzyme